MRRLPSPGSTGLSARLLHNLHQSFRARVPSDIREPLGVALMVHAHVQSNKHGRVLVLKIHDITGVRSGYSHFLTVEAKTGKDCRVSKNDDPFVKMPRRIPDLGVVREIVLLVE